VRQPSVPIMQVRAERNQMSASHLEGLQALCSPKLRLKTKIKRAKQALKNHLKQERKHWTEMDKELTQMRLRMANELAVNRLASRTPLQVVHGVIPDRPPSALVPVYRQFLILREYLFTGLRPSWNLQERILSEMPEEQRIHMVEAAGGDAYA